MKRRTLLVGLAQLLAMSQVGAQAANAPLVVWVGLATEAADQPALGALRQGLAQIGHVEGKSIRLETIHAANQADRLPAMVSEFEARGVAVFVAAGRAAARALVRLTKVPIVAGRLPEIDPDLFANLASPGGNVTGFSNFAGQLYHKQIEILKELLPDLLTVGILYSVTSSRNLGSDAVAAAGQYGLRSIRLELGARPHEELPAHISSLRARGAGALVVVQDFGTISLRDEIYRLALAERLPTVADQRDMAEAGALMTYGADISDQFRRVAGYVDRVLKGARPADLPIQLATVLQFVVNLKTAAALGLTIPPSILIRADEVIE